MIRDTPMQQDASQATTLRALRGIPAFLSTLSTFPDGDNVLRAALDGPLAPFHPVASVLWKVQDQHLDILGSYGHTSAELEQWQHQPLNQATPSAECAREGQILVYSEDTVLQTFPALTHIEIDTEEMHSFVFGSDPHSVGFAGEVVLAPIQASGIPCGVLGFITGAQNEWSSHTHSLITTVCSGIALWMSNPRSSESARDDSAFILTERQLHILNLIAAGRSSAYIAAHMGYSLSTINQELQRINAELKVQDRIAAVRVASDAGLLDG